MRIPPQHIFLGLSLLGIGFSGCYDIHAEKEGFQYEQGYYLNDGSVGFGNKIDGEWEGEVLFRNELRQPISKGTYSRGIRNGYWEFWHPNGKIQARGEFREGKRVGQWEYFYADGNQMSTGSFSGDKRVGKWQFWYANGQMQEMREYRNGQNRLIASWFPDGKEMVVNGSGSYAYLSDGMNLEEGAYLDSLMHGPWRFYNPDGTLKSSGEYQKGKKIQ